MAHTHWTINLEYHKCMAIISFSCIYSFVLCWIWIEYSALHSTTPALVNHVSLPWHGIVGRMLTCEQHIVLVVIEGAYETKSALALLVHTHTNTHAQSIFSGSTPKHSYSTPSTFSTCNETRENDEMKERRDHFPSVFLSVFDSPPFSIRLTSYFRFGVLLFIVPLYACLRPADNVTRYTAHADTHQSRINTENFRHTYNTAASSQQPHIRNAWRKQRKIYIGVAVRC